MTDYTVMTHPLIQHKISKLRDKNTGTAEFRALVEEIAMLMGYEALKDLPTEDVCIETPIEECMTPVIAGRNLAIVPILRAGLGMVSGLQALVPTAKIGHIGLYRDEETHEPHEYYCKLPDPIDERLIVVTDPMLATGGSAVAAVDFIKQHGGKHIKFMSIIAAPQGIERLLKAHPDIQLYVGHVDRELYLSIRLPTSMVAVRFRILYPTAAEHPCPPRPLTIHADTFCSGYILYIMKRLPVYIGSTPRRSLMIRLPSTMVCALTISLNFSVCSLYRTILSCMSGMASISSVVMVRHASISFSMS